MQKKIISEISQLFCSNKHFDDHKNFESYFIKSTFRLVIIGTVWHLFSNLKLKDKNSVFWKNSKMDPYNKKFENPSTTHKFYVDLGPKRYLGQRDPIIGRMGFGV